MTSSVMAAEERLQWPLEAVLGGAGGPLVARGWSRKEAPNAAIAPAAAGAACRRDPQQAAYDIV